MKRILPLALLLLAACGPRVLYTEYEKAPGRTFYCEGKALGITEARWVSPADAKELVATKMWKCSDPRKTPGQ